MRRRAVLSVVAIAGAVALGTPRAAEPQPQAPAPLEDAGAVTSPETMSPPEELQSAAWPKPAAGLSASGDPELLLTFDDGPALDKTPKVLDLLDQHGYKAVFFVCGVHFQGKGPAQEKARALLREIVKRGHLVANHTIHHLSLCGKQGAQKAVEEIEGNSKLIEEAIGEKPYLFRTPL